ncbi:AAA family ATPase [Sphingomonas sp. HT-1]|uniref:AAA family ATPase n=1 Tax=unclassified Sphingomonas TaxID=196159 RepID=UPI00030950A7|nr:MULTISPECIES: Flp pilus assembly protein ATPase CpaE [unclassified Sphingomonas]KTF67913.1 pilus assembly protein CpaE [Sphingomonas sp. WG]
MNMPFNPQRAGDREPFAAFVCDDATLEMMRPVTVELGWAPEKVMRGSPRDAVQTLAVSASPSILFVDLSDSSDPLSDIHALAEVCEPGTVVITAGQLNDVRLYRALLASSVQDYLLKPIHPELLREAFLNAQANLYGADMREVQSGRPHCAVAVIGTRGGVGATSIATSLAWLISNQGQTTALLDLDVHFGTGALSLDLEPGRGLTDAIENPSRIDGLFIERAMVRASERLAVLSAEAPIHAPMMGDGAVFYQLQEEMRHAFDCTVVDLPRQMLVHHPHLIADVQVAVLVTELTLASARDAIRILSWLKTNAPETRVLIVANKVPSAAMLEISRKDFEGSIEQKLDLVLPFEPRIAAQAAKLGKPIANVAKGHRGLAGLADLARRIIAIGEASDAGDAAPAKPIAGASLLGRLGGLKALLAPSRT